MAQNYQWLTFVQARQQLQARLAMSGDPTRDFWTDVECGLYIIEALRTFNALTATWKADFTYSSGQLWNSLATLANSPRLRTVTDTDVYTMMENHLIEPPTGGTWTGTTQFSIGDLSGALQRRRDLIIQIVNCNCSILSGIAALPNQRRTILPDTVIDLMRTRYLATGGAPPPVTLYRDDTLAMEYFEDDFYTQPSGIPQAFMISTEPPLAFDVDVPPAFAGVYEGLVSNSGTAFAPPASTLLGIPDDYAWVAKWGALADLLGRESEATDRQRAEYCEKRFDDGLQLLLKSPWILLGKINSQTADLPSVQAMDRYYPEWDSDPNFTSSVVLAGIDFIAAPTNQGIGVTVLGNAPVPALDSDFIQASRSNWDSILDYAQFLASFKQGGGEFQSAQDLEASFILACAAENDRLVRLGLFSDVLLPRAAAADRSQERY